MSSRTTTTTTSSTTDGSSSSSWIRGVNLGGWLVLERFITPYLFAVTSCHIRGNYCRYPGQLSAPTSYAPCDLYACKPHLLSYPSGTPVLTTVAADGSSKNTALNNVNVTPVNDTTSSSSAAEDGSFIDYPVDSWTLMSSFDSPALAADYLNVHYEHFVTFEHLKRLKEQGGVDYVRVPLPHWILQNDSAVFGSNYNSTTNHQNSTQPPSSIRLNIYGEPYVAGNMWFYFTRLVQWCHELDIQVWPDLHTAPGSQNGFDNSGHWAVGQEPTCQGWSASPQRVSRTLDLLQGIVQQIASTTTNNSSSTIMKSTITGFGILNEPFKDCPPNVMQDYNRRAIQIVRAALGPDTSIYIADNFNATLWQQPQQQQQPVSTNSDPPPPPQQPQPLDSSMYWNPHDPLAVELYQNTFLDSHYYHVFAEEPRALSPRQHIAYVCQYNARYTTSCCYDTPSPTMLQRMIGEWSAAYDTLPVAKLQAVMQNIRTKGQALDANRVLSKIQRDFLKQFVRAQMVVYEAADYYKDSQLNYPTNNNNATSNRVSATSAHLSRGWFYWTFQMEGGAFCEWDFLRGLREGWISKIPPSHVSSTSLYGSCDDILFQTSDDAAAIVHEYPDPATLPKHNWQGVEITDDVVVSHGASLLKKQGQSNTTTTQQVQPPSSSPLPPSATGSTTVTPMDKGKAVQRGMGWFLYIAIAFFTYAIWRVFCRKRERDQYVQIDV